MRMILFVLIISLLCITCQQKNEDQTIKVIDIIYFQSNFRTS